MPDLILLPGLACDAALFEHQAAALGRTHRVHVSDAHARCGSLPAMATALLAEQAGPLVLIGCSMGGMLALEMARQAPERVRGIALLGSTASPDTPKTLELREQACELYANGRMEDVLGANVIMALHADSAARPALVQAYLAMIRRAGPDQLIRQNRIVMARQDYRPLLPQLRCPVLVACGEADRLTPPEVSRELAAAIPGARLQIVAGAGHMLTMEHPQAVTALLQDWLRSISA